MFATCVSKARQGTGSLPSLSTVSVPGQLCPFFSPDSYTNLSEAIADSLHRDAYTRPQRRGVASRRGGSSQVDGTRGEASTHKGEQRHTEQQPCACICRTSSRVRSRSPSTPSTARHRTSAV